MSLILIYLINLLLGESYEFTYNMLRFQYGLVFSVYFIGQFCKFLVVTLGMYIIYVVMICTYRKHWDMGNALPKNGLDQIKHLILMFRYFSIWAVYFVHCTFIWCFYLLQIRDICPFHLGINEYITWWFSESCSYIFPNFYEEIDPWFDYKIWPIDIPESVSLYDTANISLIAFKKNMNLSFHYSEAILDLLVYIFMITVLLLTIRTFKAYYRHFLLNKDEYSNSFARWLNLCFFEFEHALRLRTDKDFVNEVGLTQLELTLVFITFIVSVFGPLYIWRYKTIIWPYGEKVGMRDYGDWNTIKLSFFRIFSEKTFFRKLYMFITNTTNYDTVNNKYNKTDTNTSSSDDDDIFICKGLNYSNDRAINVFRDMRFSPVIHYFSFKKFKSGYKVPRTRLGSVGKLKTWEGIYTYDNEFTTPYQGNKAAAGSTPLQINYLDELEGSMLPYVFTVRPFKYDGLSFGDWELTEHTTMIDVLEKAWNSRLMPGSVAMYLEKNEMKETTFLDDEPTLDRPNGNNWVIKYSGPDDAPYLLPIEKFDVWHKDQDAMERFLHQAGVPGVQGREVVGKPTNFIQGFNPFRVTFKNWLDYSKFKSGCPGFKFAITPNWINSRDEISQSNLFSRLVKKYLYIMGDFIESFTHVSDHITIMDRLNDLGMYKAMCKFHLKYEKMCKDNKLKYIKDNGTLNRYLNLDLRPTLPLWRILLGFDTKTDIGVWSRRWWNMTRKMTDDTPTEGNHYNWFKATIRQFFLKPFTGIDYFAQSLKKKKKLWDEVQADMMLQRKQYAKQDLNLWLNRRRYLPTNYEYPDLRFVQTDVEYLKDLRYANLCNLYSKEYIDDLIKTEEQTVESLSANLGGKTLDRMYNIRTMPTLLDPLPTVNPTKHTNYPSSDNMIEYLLPAEMNTKRGENVGLVNFVRSMFFNAHKNPFIQYLFKVEDLMRAESWFILNNRIFNPYVNNARWKQYFRNIGFPKLDGLDKGFTLDELSDQHIWDVIHNLEINEEKALMKLHFHLVSKAVSLYRKLQYQAVLRTYCNRYGVMSSTEVSNDVISKMLGRHRIIKPHLNRALLEPVRESHRDPLPRWETIMRLVKNEGRESIRKLGYELMRYKHFDSVTPDNLPHSDMYIFARFDGEELEKIKNNYRKELMALHSIKKYYKNTLKNLIKSGQNNSYYSNFEHHTSQLGHIERIHRVRLCEYLKFCAKEDMNNKLMDTVHTLGTYHLPYLAMAETARYNNTYQYAELVKYAKRVLDNPKPGQYISTIRQLREHVISDEHYSALFDGVRHPIKSSEDFMADLERRSTRVIDVDAAEEEAYRIREIRRQARIAEKKHRNLHSKLSLGKNLEGFKNHKAEAERKAAEKAALMRAIDEARIELEAKKAAEQAAFERLAADAAKKEQKANSVRRIIKRRSEK